MNASMGLSAWALTAIPVVIISLWYVFKRSDQGASKKNYLSSEYFTGLNYLLNDEQGKALDIFVKLVESDWDIIDTHFALGKIFRKNGETDKAIKIHQGLIARPSLPEKYRTQVLLELGYDYLSAGWFDRAEGLFKEVLIHDPDSDLARRNLIIIYQQEKDWHKAIEIAIELHRYHPDDYASMISQYYCELAEISRGKGDKAQAIRDSRKALQYDPNSVRASLQLAEQSMDEEKYDEAIRLFRQIENQDVEFVPVILDHLIESYIKLGKQDDLLVYLDELESKCANTSLMEKHAAVIEQFKDKDAVIAYLTAKLNQQPSLEGMHHLLVYKSNQETGDTEFINAMKIALQKLRYEDAEYQCHHCGFQSNTLYWLCPSCHSWGAVKPVFIEAN